MADYLVFVWTNYMDNVYPGDINILLRLNVPRDTVRCAIY